MPVDGEASAVDETSNPAPDLNPAEEEAKDLAEGTPSRSPLSRRASLQTRLCSEFGAENVLQLLRSADMRRRQLAFAQTLAILRGPATRPGTLPQFTQHRGALRTARPIITV